MLRDKKRARSRSVSKMAGKKKNGKVASKRYTDKWFMSYFSDLPKDKTPRFPPNPDVALRSYFTNSVLAVGSLADCSSHEGNYQADTPSVRHISAAS